MLHFLDVVFEERQSPTIYRRFLDAMVQMSKVAGRGLFGEEILLASGCL